jgi:cytochrome c5
VSNNQDTHFLNIFSLVIGLLAAIAILLLALARVVGNRTEVADVYQDPEYIQSVIARIRPVVREAIAGQDNSALKIQAPAVAGATVALAVPKDGRALFEAVCKTCHGTGLAGAPKAGDKAAWASRIAEGKATLYQHALHGYSGKTGVMPAKGGRTDLPDALIEQGVDYMVSLVQK